jgi:hypothetical protein
MAGRLTYPYNEVYDKFTDYVMLTFYEYRPPFASEGGNADRSTVKYYNNSGSKEYEAVKGLPNILLYMPEDITTGYGVQWADKSFTNTATQLLRTAGPLLKTGDFGTTVTSLGETLKSTAGRLPSAVASLVADGINSLPGGVGGSVDLNDVLGGAKGIVLNPNYELLFGGFGLREFNLNFKMAPRGKNEAQEIKKITQLIRYAMLPKYGKPKDLDLGADATVSDQDNIPENLPSGTTLKKGDKVNDNYISVPYLCRVKFMKGGVDHPYLPKYKMCVVNSMDIGYTPDGVFNTYDDGSPVATTMSISFSETKLVFGDEIKWDNVKNAQY